MKKYTLHQAAEMLGTNYNKLYYVLIRNRIGTQGFKEWSLTDKDIEKAGEIISARKPRGEK